MKTIREEIIDGENLLKSCNIPDWKNSTKLIFCKAISIDVQEYNSYLIKYENDIMDSKVAIKFRKLVKRRSKHIPLIAIIGSRPFMDLTIPYNRNVLIPRDETEILADMVVVDILDYLKTHKAKNVSLLDMCTGSGCLGLSITQMVESASKGVRVDTSLVDISTKALKVAKRNWQYNVSNVFKGKQFLQNVEFIKSDLFERVQGKYDVIVCNPPYIKRGDLESLEIEVKDFEPKLALDGGEDGLDFYRKIIEIVPNYLDDEGLRSIYFEIGIDQSHDIVKLLKKDFEDIKILKDYAGIDRYIMAKKRVENVK
jgi:release factor glutamine methyltransferase